MKKLITCAILSISLTSCALTSGETAYTIEPIELANGEVACCKVTVNNTKDYDKFKFNLKKKPDGTISVSLEEEGVSSSNPAAVAAANQSKLIDAVTTLLPKGTN